MAANPYDDILAAPSSVSAGGPAANPYDDILGGEQDRQQAQLRANVSLAAGSNPQAIAAQRQLAKYVGYKPAVGEALPDEIKAMAAVKRVADDAAGSPVLQKAYTDADFARIGHDDSGALSAVGEAVASLTKYLMGATPTGGFIGALKATPALAAEGILGAKKAMVDVVEPWARLVTQNPDNTFSTLSKYYSARSAEEKAKAEALSPADNSIIGGGLQAGFQSLGGNSKYLPLAFLPGGAPFALAGMGIETFGHSYNRAADKNIPLMARLLYAASDATIEVATETGPLGALVHGVKAGAPFVRTMLTNAIKENKGEQVATLLQDANEWAVLNPDKPFVEYLKERPAAAVQTLIATLVGVGGNTALAEGVQRASDAVAGRQRQIDLSLDQVDKLQGLFKAALDSKVRERDPVSFGNLVQQMAEATPGAPANVFIDARALTDALAANPEAAGVFNQMPAEVQAQVQEALATGGAVEIPLGDLVSKGAGTALEAALLPHIRTSLDGLSQTEAKDAAGQAATYLQQEADRAIAESDRSETIAASADAVHSQVLDQLNAINRNTPDVNGAYATLIKAFYTATSARLGMTPEEMYAKHPLSIKGETVGAGYNSQTGAFGPRFQQFKGDAAGAIAHLVQQQDGEAIGALHHPDLGDIDLVWGEAGTGASDGYGLAKLLKWHPEVVDGLQEILSSMKVASRSENRIRLESADHAASVRLSWDGQAKHWLLTAYEKRGDTGTRTDTADTSGGDDTARPTDASESIVDAKLQQYYQGELNQSDSKVHNLTSTAERGSRVEGTRSMLSEKEKAEITKSAAATGLSAREITETVRSHKLAHPREQGWAPLVFTGAGLDDKGKVVYNYQGIPYGFSSDADGQQIPPGSPAYTKRVNAVARAMADEVRRVFHRAAGGDQNAQNILAQAGWYKAMRARLRQEFGGLGDLFADLLGATSPNTPVRDNWTNAVDTLRRATRGDFDELMPQWVAWADKVDALETEFRGWFNEQLAEGQAKVAQATTDKKTKQEIKAIGAQYTKAAIFRMPEYVRRAAEVSAARKIDDALLPTKESGAKYGFNGKNVINAMIDLWRVVSDADADINRGGTAPKALNFSGNLIGFRERATIDVWAARMLQRLAGLLRIPSRAEMGVSGEMRSDASTTLQFGMGQDIFTAAVARIRADPEMKANDTLAKINDDDLQAVVWFIEKEIWTVNNWTSTAGEAGSFELEASLTGTQQQTRVRELRKLLDAGKPKADVEGAAVDVSAERAVLAKFAEDTASDREELAALVADGKEDTARAKKLAKDTKPPVLESRAVARVDKAQAKLDAQVQGKIDAKAELASLERSVDRFVGGLSTQMSLDTQGVDFVPTDADMARLAEKIRLAAYEGDGHTQVLASKMLSTQGRYGGIERSLDMEVVAREGYNPQALWVEMLRQAQAARQDSTFLSRVLRDKEDHNPLIHRPGVEVYFKDAASAAKLEVVLADLAKEGVEFLTVIVDGRRMPGYVAGDMPAAVGVRMQYVPEFDQRYGFDDLSGLTDDEIAAKIEMKADEMSAIAERVSLVEGVAFAGTFWHETQVAFSHQYQEKIDVVATGISEEATGAVGGTQWSGQSVRSGIEDADRQVREAASGQPVGQLGDVLGGDAQRTAVGADQSQQTLGQQARGTYNPATLTISLLQTADLSTFLHEAGHFFLEVMADLASQENAPEQITADFGKILKWFGVKDAEDGTKAIDVWRAMTLDEKRPHHERWAESFEHYLIEGKAPSLELRGPFQRFRGWLTTVYKSLRDFAAGRDLKISGEIRAVMDRLVATEDQISEAEQQAKYEAVYKTAEEAGMDEHEWAVYQAMHQEGTDAAIDQMQARSISDLKWAAEARSKALRQAQRAVDSLRKAMRVTVTEAVMASPIEQARAWIKDMRQSTPEQKAALKAWTDQRAAVLAAALAQAKADLIAANPDAKGIQKGQLLAKNNKAMANQAEAQAIAWEQDNRRPTPVLPAIEMDSVAERFGFTSGDELTKKMASEPSAKDTIDGLTEQRLMEEHGELITPQGVQQAANEAIHNEARARFVATELATLQHAMNQKAKAPGAKVATNVLVAAAKQFAQAIVGRRKISDLKPGRYTAAETRAAAAVQKAMAAGDQAAAVAAQRDKLLNLFAAKETVSARDELIRAVEYLRKFERDSVRSKLPPEYLDQIDALLEKFDLKAATTQKEIARRKSLASWLASQQDLGIEPNIPQELIDKAGLTSYKDLTVDEMRGLVDTIKQIEHLARLKSKLLTARDQREYAAIRDEIAASINHYAGDRQADTRTPTTNMGRWFQAVKNFGAAHIKAATWARVMDGGKAGGPVWEYFIRPANERGDMETKMRAEAAAALHEIIAPWLKGKPAGGKGVFFPTIGRSMNRESILALALNTGNEGNLQRLLGGENWALQDIKPVLDTLSRSDWEVVQKIWDHFESYRPLIGAKEMRVYGKEPDWIKPAARQFTLADGTTMSLAGGYYPIKYDPAASVRAEEHADAEGAKRLLKGAYGAATTSRSFTKARVEEVVGRPLLYTLSGLYSGVNDVIHDLAWHEWLIDANRLLKSQTIDSAIREHYGPEAVRQLKSWRDAIAEGDAGSDQAIDAALGRLRQGVSVAGLGFNVMSAMMQPLGMTQSIVRVGAKWIGRGSLQYIANPRQATREVQAQSDFMASRARTQFRELNEIRNTVQGQTAAKTVMTQTAYYLMMQCQQMVDVPTWLGAYEKAMSEGNDDERSVALADQAVIDAQGGGMTKDLSAMERGGPAQKLFTVFYSFMNTALNLGVGQAMTSQKTTAGRAKLAADMLMLYTVPAVLGTLLKDALTPGDSGDSDDWRKLLRKLIGEQLTFLLGLMVVAREFGEVGKTLLGLSDHPRDYAGPAGVRLVADAGNAAKQIQQGEFDDQLRKAVINLAGDIFGLPAAQVNRTITGFNALKEGKTHNPAALAFGYQEPH